jgi:hypothetical protein
MKNTIEFTMVLMNLLGERNISIELNLFEAIVKEDYRSLIE